jgi:tRNA A37 threonylcarbamoyladenosine dehydratase
LENKINFISSMGAGKKTDPTKLAIMEIQKTTYDPLAKILRRKLREEKISDKIIVSSSTEAPADIPALGSYMPVTATAGLMLADYIIKQIITGGKF